MNRRLLFICGLLIAAALGISPGAEARIRPAQLADSTISPIKITASKGDTIRWDALAGVHYLIADSASPYQWNSDTIASGGSFDHFVAYTDPSGTFLYRCALHPNETYQLDLHCCVAPLRSNVDNSPETGVPGIGYGTNIQDVIRLVNWLFSGQAPPPCLEEANVDGSLSPAGTDTFGILDVNRLVGWLFAAGASPAACP